MTLVTKNKPHNKDSTHPPLPAAEIRISPEKQHLRDDLAAAADHLAALAARHSVAIVASGTAAGISISAVETIRKEAAVDV